MGEPKPAASYLHGSGQGAIIIVPARVADWLIRRTDLGKARVLARGTDPELSAVLRALYVGGLGWQEAVGARSPRTSAIGSKPAEVPEVTTSLKKVGTTAAARLLGITDRAVRLAIDEKRLPAERVNGRWCIAREDIEQYRAGRTN